LYWTYGGDGGTTQPLPEGWAEDDSKKNQKSSHALRFEPEIKDGRRQHKIARRISRDAVQSRR